MIKKSSSTSAKNEYAKKYNSRLAAYRIVETLKRKGKNLCKRTRSEVAVIHFMPKTDCARASSASFGTKNSMLEALFEENALGVGMHIIITKTNHEKVFFECAKMRVSDFGRLGDRGMGSVVRGEG